MEGNNVEPVDLNKDEWDLPFEFEEIPLPEWPHNVFAEPAQRYVDELSRSSETPRELASMLYLSVVATAAQKNYMVEIKKGYCEPVNIYALPILPPASRKSSVLAEITSPLRAWEAQQKILLAPEVNSEISKQKTREERIKQLRRDAAKTTDETEVEAIQKQIIEIEEKINSQLNYPQLWTSDITPEHLGTVMAANGGAMAILSDEGGIFNILSGLYSAGNANIDLFLQAHTGSSFRVDRRTKPPIFIEKALLTLALTIQPQVIIKACNNPIFRGRGLLARFLYVIPESNIGYRTLQEQAMDDAVRHEFNVRIATLLNHTSQTTPVKMHILQLEPEAHEKWLEYAQAIEKMMHPDLGVLSHITDWAGKLCGQIARIAAVIHIDRYALKSPWERKISAHDMANAIRIGHALIQHALKVFSLTNDENGIPVAKEILQWIEDFKLETFTHRECLRKFRKYRKKHLRPAFKSLKEYNYIHEVENKDKSKGAPSAIYYVNPHFKSIRNGQKGQ